MNSPFRIAVINDEIGQDFGRACEVASREFGMEWVELRGMWSKNILKLDANEVAEARRILGINAIADGVHAGVSERRSVPGMAMARAVRARW